jgi:hypothetical protein
MRVAAAWAGSAGTGSQDRKRLAYPRYRGGVDTLLNALNADQDLFQTELNCRKSEERPAHGCPTKRWVVVGDNPVSLRFA